MGETLLESGITREQARKNILKADPNANEEDVNAIIHITENMDERSFSEAYQKVLFKKNRYIRLYCPSCEIIYNRQSMGVIRKCTKCGQDLVFKSFNPYSQFIFGLVVMGLGGLTIVLRLPIVWAGAFIYGGKLLFNGFDQWNKIKNIEKVK